MGNMLKFQGRLRTFASGLAFYALIAVLAGELIFFSLGTAPLPRPASAQAGQSQAGQSQGAQNQARRIVLDPAALQHVALRGLIGYVPRARNGSPLALRLAASQSSTLESGARLELTPNLKAASAGKRLRILIQTQPLEVTNAAALAVRLEGNMSGAWSRLELQEGKAMRLAYDFPAVPEGVSAIWLRPIAPDRVDYNFGTEIRSVEILIIPALTPNE